MPRKNNRSAETGRFVSRAEAKRSPGTTVQEADENFVSERMEAAGTRALSEWLPVNATATSADIVRDIYKAMRRAR